MRETADRHRRMIDLVSALVNEIRETKRRGERQRWLGIKRSVAGGTVFRTRFAGWQRVLE